MKIARNIAITIICVMLGVMLALQYKSVNANQSLAAYENMRLEELKSELIKLQNQKDSLQDRVRELEAENQKYASAKVGSSEAVQQIQNSLTKARVFAGLETVKGKGLIVVLDNNGLVEVQDYDLLDVINELRAAGAQAISLNEERIVAMTEIRTASPYIMVNGKPLSAPYTIKAISDPDNLERSLSMLGGVVDTLKGDYHINVTLKKSDEIIIGKFVDDGTTIKTNLLEPVN